MTDKTTLRARMKALRAGLCSPERDAAIAEYVLSAFGEEQSFFVYLSFGSEVGTEALIRALLARGKTVCVPRIVGGEMCSVPYREPLERGKYGILQPRAGEEKTCAVALTPLLAWDREGFRLGYGGGYYDRYFAAHPGVLRVGLAYAGQAVRELPRERTDIPLHAAVTEEGVTRFL